MKRKQTILVTAFLLSGSILFSSCVGSFAMFNRLSSWNQKIGNKFVNELVFLAFNIIPAYGVASLIDGLVLNSIEFWTGNNPMAKAGDVKKVKGENDNFIVETEEDGYTITKEGSETAMQLVYDKDNNTWNVVDMNGNPIKLIRINNNETASLFLPDGNTMDVTLNAEGLQAARDLINNGIMYASR